MMKRVFAIAALFVVAQQPCGVAASSKMLRGRRRDAGIVELQNPCLLLEKVERLENNQEVVSIQCQLEGSDIQANHGIRMVSIQGMTAAATSFQTGETTWFAQGATVIDHVIYHDSEPILVTPPQNNNNNNRQLSKTTGTRSLLVVRVESSDSETTASESRLQEQVFGRDKVNLVSQYKACSYNQLEFVPATGGFGITNGVTTTRIDRSTKSGKPEGQVAELVLQQLQDDQNTQHLEDRFDHVLLCLPKDTNGGKWIGYAYVNSWLLVLNDEWCASLSGQMHEMAHNLNLSHSGENNSYYSDQSGLMGYSYFQAEAPRMCFNGAKSWQLGWYQDRHHTFDPTLTEEWSGDLMGVSEYDLARGDTKILVQIVGQSQDYYVALNRKSGMNAGTLEGANEVLITSRPKGNDHGQSMLEAKLDVGDAYVNNDEYQGETIRVLVEDMMQQGNNNNALVARVSITSTMAPAQQQQQDEDESEEIVSCWDVGNDFTKCMNQGCAWDAYSNRCF